jgi:hypothetical protein
MNKRYKIIISFVVIAILAYYYQKYMNKRYLEKFNNTSKLETEGFIGSKTKEHFVDQMMGNITEETKTIDDTQLDKIKLDFFKITKNSVLLTNTKFNTFNLEWFRKNVPIFYNVSNDKDTEIKTNSSFLKYRPDVNSKDKSFGLIFTYSSSEIEDKTFFKMPLTSELDFSVRLINNASIDSKLIVSYLNSKYTFEIGNIIINRIYTIIVEDLSTISQLAYKIKLLVDGVEIKCTQIDEVKPNNYGTCPNGWKNIGNNKCSSEGNFTEECRLDEIEINDKTNRTIWIKKCNMNWNNCTKLETNESAPFINDNPGTSKNTLQNVLAECKIKEDYNIESVNKVIINRLSRPYTIYLINYSDETTFFNIQSIGDKAVKLTQELKFISNYFPEMEQMLQESCFKLVNDNYKSYGLDLSNESTLSKIKNYLDGLINPSSNNNKLSNDAIPMNAIPTNANNAIPISVNNDIRPMGIVPEECIFNDSNLCTIKECQGIDWNNPENVNIICKSKINDYCKGNTTDNGCNKLREIKYKKEMETKSTPPKYHPSVELPNLVKNCSNCTNKIDLSKY